MNRNSLRLFLFIIIIVSINSCNTKKDNQSGENEVANSKQLVEEDEQIPSTAIDILLDPDTIMLKQAKATNKRLLMVYPKGFALDEAHQPHITCLQRFVKTSDLDKVSEAINNVLTDEKPMTWKLKAYKYYYIPFNDLGLAGIVI